MPRGAENREAGESPARSRHCKQKYTAIYVTDSIGKAVVCVAVSQETCQTVVRGMRYSRSRGLIVPNEDRYTQSSAFLRWIFLCEQRAKVRACVRPWRLPRYLAKIAQSVSHSCHISLTPVYVWFMYA